MSQILADNSIVNAGCAPITMVYWRIVNMDTSLDILVATGDVPGADATGIHTSFVGGTFLEPEVNFSAFNGVATQIKFIKQIKDSCGNLSPKEEIIFNADATSGNFEIECMGVTIAFAKEVTEYTASYPDNSDITLANIPMANSIQVTKNNSLVLVEDTHYTVSGVTVTILNGSDDPTPTDTDVFEISYAYQA